MITAATSYPFAITFSLHPFNINMLIFVFIGKMFLFLFLATCEDYKLLEKLNNMTSSKYEDLSSKSVMLTENIISLNEKCKLGI